MVIPVISDGMITYIYADAYMKPEMKEVFPWLPR